MALTKIDISSANKVNMKKNCFCFYSVLIEEKFLKKNALYFCTPKQIMYVFNRYV